MLTLAVTVKLVIEIALFSLLGQAVVGFLSGRAKTHNLVYRLLQLTSQPWLRAVRWIFPNVVPNRHMPLVTAFLLLALWLVAALAKVGLCVHTGVVLCK